MEREHFANWLTLRQINDDHQFVERLAPGDLNDVLDEKGVIISPGPLSELFRAAYEPLLNLFLQYRIADAEDFTIEFFIHLRTALMHGKYRHMPAAKFSTWLFKAATNFALNYKKKEDRLGRHVKFIHFDEAGECFRRADGSWELDFFERYVPPTFSMLLAISPPIEEEEAGQANLEGADADREWQVRAALYLIDDKYRSFLLLRYGEGLSYDKIVKSRRVRDKNGKPLSKGTIFNMEEKAIKQLVMAYVNIGLLTGHYESNRERKEDRKVIEGRAPA